jgi:hypothetical protein
MSYTITAGPSSIVLNVTQPFEADGVTPRDDLIGLKVWYSTTSGFTPSGSNIVYDGTGLTTTITGLISGTAYYLRYALISEIEPDNYTLSSQITATPTGATAPKNSIAYLYQWSTSQPGNPNGASTYTWSTGANSSYTGSNGWSTTIGSNPGTPLLQLWTASRAVIDTTGTATTTQVDWSTGYSVSSISQNGAFGQNGGTGGPGASGYNTTTVRLYRTGVTQPSPAPSGSSTYTWSTSSFSYANTGSDGWSTTPPTSSTGLQGQTLWAAQVTITDVATNGTTTINWSGAAIVALSYYGTQGSQSTTPGPQGASARVAYAVTTTTPSGTTSQGINYTISGDSLPPTGTWFSGVAWSRNAPSAALTEGQFLYQVDGLYDPSTGVNSTTWFGVPYLSNLKVGNLQAISANTGTLTVTGTISVTGDTANGVLIKTDGIYIYKDSKVRVKLGNI